MHVEQRTNMFKWQMLFSKEVTRPVYRPPIFLAVLSDDAHESLNRVKKGVFLVRKGSNTTFYIVKIRKMCEKKGKIRKTWLMTKKRSSEMFAVKMEIFPEKDGHSEILVREIFFRPPKLGARSPPLPV